jgi:NAD+ synthase
MSSKTKTINLIEHITKWLKDYKACNPYIKGFVVGVSGGIDSAVVSTLCASTGISLLVFELPIHQSKSEVQRSSKHVQWLKQQYGKNVRSHFVDLTSAFEAMKTTLTKIETNSQEELALANRERIEYFIPFNIR